MNTGAGHRFFGVTGNPVLHSRSPLMFREIFNEYSMDASYIRVAVREAADAARLMREIGFSGMNVTAPFKLGIVNHLDKVTDDALKLASVNTVVSSAGVLNGYNTDFTGVADALESHAGNISGKRVIIAGAGGAGVAAAWGALSRGAHVTILNITLPEAEAAARKTGCSHDLLANLNRYTPSADIFVSAIPYEADELDISGMRPGTFVMDASYKKSRYESAAAKLGLNFIPGEEWLVYQAIPACRLFTGITPPAELLKKGLSRAAAPKRNISLIGFMGSGKSSAGRELARMRNMEFIDTDELIEKRMNMKISDIFTTLGEERFREIETETLLSLKGLNNIIISCGGGIVLRDKNRRFLVNETECFWLYTSAEESLSRITDDSRPLLAGDNKHKKAHELFEKRKPLYAQACTALVISEGNPEHTAEHINEEINLAI
ncbi:MAG TPA: shikimate kinase [Spirochaetota bacterium]|nr:shikimate kinase [Spirochaetota bacterium]